MSIRTACRAGSSSVDSPPSRSGSKGAGASARRRAGGRGEIGLALGAGWGAFSAAIGCIAAAGGHRSTGEAAVRGRVDAGSGDLRHRRSLPARPRAVILRLVESRSPLRIAVESLAEARAAASAGDLERALDLVADGLAALGPHYQRAGLIDDSGLKLTLAAAQRRRGDLAGAFAAMEAVLEDRIAAYEGRSGDAS